MDRDTVGLRDNYTQTVGEIAGEIVRVVENWAARRPGHDPAHLLGDVVEPVLH